MAAAGGNPPGGHAYCEWMAGRKGEEEEEGEKEEEAKGLPPSSARLSSFPLSSFPSIGGCEADSDLPFFVCPLLPPSLPLPHVTTNGGFDEKMMMMQSAKEEGFSLASFCTA